MDTKYKEKAHKLVDQVDEKINFIEGKVSENTTEMKEEAVKTINKAKSKKDEFQGELAKTKELSKERFAEMKSDVDTKLNDLKDVYHYLKVKWTDK